MAKSTPTRAIKARVISLMGLPLFRFRLKTQTQSWCLDTVTEKWEVPSYSVERTAFVSVRTLFPRALFFLNLHSSNVRFVHHSPL